MSDTRRYVLSRTRLYALGAFVAFGTAGVVLCYLLLDEQVMQWLLHHPQEWHRDTWVNAFRQLGKACVPIWLLLVWSFLTNKWRPTAITCIALLLTSATVCSLKVMTRRERPNQRIGESADSAALEHEPWHHVGVSFPSGDTAAAFAVATVLTAMTRRAWGPVFFASAGVIGLLRITSLNHYPSDVWAGMLIGILAGFCAPRLALHRLPRELLEKLCDLRDWQRLVFGSLLVFVVPALSSYLGVQPLLIFLRVYAAPVAVLILVAAWIGRARAPRQEQTPRDLEGTE